MIATKWGPELAGETRPEFDDYEPESCSSLYWLPPDPDRHGSQSLRCPLDADHRHDQFDARHGRGLTRWTDEQAAENLADFGPRPAASCSDCSSPAVTRGLCAVCAKRELAADDRETEVEAA